MKKKGHRIKSVDPGSIAEELELEPGDTLLSIDGHEIEDIFDYEYYVNSESMVMLVQKAGGEEWELEIEHEYSDLGINFENGLMSEYRSCRNKCIFCFIDQMPPGMRDTLYFKDDDSRLSFLQGNYITLTNMGEKDIERIIKFKLSPINISVHTTNPELRCRMLNNRFAGEALKKIDMLYKAKTPMNGQIVLCKGVNDNKELERTIKDLGHYLPYMESVSIVPVGLSKYRDGLYPLEPFEKEDAEAVIDLVEHWQNQFYQDYGNHFIHASDEFYILAGRKMPEAERYDGYIQLENGVGMIRLMTEEVLAAIEELDADDTVDELSIATGKLAAPYLEQYVTQIQGKWPGRTIHVYPIENRFFGERITVAGLITGTDLMTQLKGCRLGQRLLLPECMFRSGEEVFLDDVTREEVQNALHLPVCIVKSSGHSFVKQILGYETSDKTEYSGYELSDPDIE